MDEATQKLSRSIWVGVGLVIVLVCIAFVLSRLKQPADEAGTASPLPIIAQVNDFSLTNQLGKLVTLADLRGKVWVADIIFTRCAGPCPRMTRQMKSLQDALPKNSDARLVSLTTDPIFDTPEVLARYAAANGTDNERWYFLTGTAKQISDLAIDGLKLTTVEKTPEERENPEDLFIHATVFVLVDKQAHLRAVFQTGGETVDWTEVRKELLAAIKRLEREP